MIISVDPGEKNIGICLFKYDTEKKKADLRVKTILSGPEALFDVLAVAEGMVSAGSKINTVVCENYRIRPVDESYNRKSPSRSPYGRSQSGGISTKDFWSEVLTIRVIGACQFFAYRVGAEFVLQESRILAMGRKWCDFPVPQSPSSHIKDDISAYIHGVHYMVQQRMIRGVDDVTKFGQEKLG
jgi:hypothetical protein